jgi:hypothetical protein
MKRALLISLLSIPFQVFAKDITCFEMKRSQDVSGWIPVEFRIVISEDLESAVVETPILKQFGQDKFEKSLFGSDYWARGSGKSKDGDYYNYSLQLRFKQNFKKYTVSMQEHGFRDLVVSGECELTSNLYQAKQTPKPQIDSNASLAGKWTTPSKPEGDNSDVDGVITFYSPNSSTFISINLRDGYYEHSSENNYFQNVYENARSTDKGQYIFYLGNDDFKPYESAWREGTVEAFIRNGHKIVRISDPSMKNFAWQSSGANLRFYIRVKGSWAGKELSGEGANRSKLNDLGKFSD